MRSKIKLYITRCKRCGKPITSANRSMVGLNKLHDMWKGICEGCLTADEKYELNIKIGVGILKETAK